MVVGNLQDTYQQFQYQVSAKLARWVSLPSYEKISQSSLARLGCEKGEGRVLPAGKSGNDPFYMVERLPTEWSPQMVSCCKF